jgi:cysteine synthase B
LTLKDIKIGNTPLVPIKNSAAANVKLLAKLEYKNPFGSVKDRAAYWMIKKAEEEGKIKRKDTILIEPTSGNTGIALSGMAKLMGYKVEVTIPQKISTETKDTLRALGAKVLETADDLCPRVGPGTDQSIALATAIVKRGKGKYFMLNQYENDANALAHYCSTGPEIWSETKGKITHFFTGVGTGGTIVGTSLYLKQKNPKVQVIAITPKNKKHKLQGLRNFNVSSKPKVLLDGIEKAQAKGISLIDKWIEVSDKDAFLAVKHLYQNEGLLVGPSSGAVIFAAKQVLSKENTAVGVMIFADDGSKYKSLYKQMKIL